MERNPILLSQVLVPGVVAALGIPQRDKVLVLEEPTWLILGLDLYQLLILCLQNVACFEQ